MTGKENQKNFVRVRLGTICATPQALQQVSHSEIAAALSRHEHGDWGDVCPEDWKANQTALVDGGRLLSSYRTTSGVKFWIITEADRSATTVLLPEDY